MRRGWGWASWALAMGLWFGCTDDPPVDFDKRDGASLDALVSSQDGGTADASMSGTDGALGAEAGGGNLPPVFEPVPDPIIPAGFPFSFRIAARDPEGQPVTLEALALPEGALLDLATATFQWTPRLDQVGDHLARFSASDGANSAELQVGIGVIEPEDPNPLPADDCEVAETPCGPVCCPADTLCLFGACVAPGEICADDAACGPGAYCEPLIEQCLPEGGGEGVCQFVPPPGEFSPVVGCRWQPNEGDPRRGRRDVVMAPVVANLSDDNGDGDTDLEDIPDLVFATYNLDSGCCNQPATLRIVSGRCNEDGTMRTLGSIDDVDVDNSAGVALGDLTGDGVPEIVAISIGAHPGGTVAFERVASDASSWRVLWRNEELPAWNVHTRGASAPSLADINQDGTADVIVGNVVLDGRDGSTLWDGVVTSGGAGGIGNNAFLGPASCVGDVDLDGRPEVAAGNTLYDADGVPRWTYEFDSSNSPCGGGLPCDGYTAMGNFDDDDEGEVVIVRRGEIFILQHTGELLWKTAIPKLGCAQNEGGPPTIADFDGDGRPEIAVAAADYYVVADPDCTEPLPPECAAPGILWQVRNRDCSSRVTASSVFDFEADGQAEVVYADETTLRIFRGRDGAILYEDDQHGSHTRLEQPIIADVDNDGNAEVVVAGNRSGGGIPGVRVYEDRDDNWVRTRRIWNQHSYHITNVDERGRVPLIEPPNWLEPGFNNFRQNQQGEGVFNAPNLVAELQIDYSECPDSFCVVITVSNDGSLAVPAGLAVTLYYGRPEAPGEVIVTQALERPLLIGESTILRHCWPVPEAMAGQAVDLFARADDAGDGRGAHNECDETDNVGALLQITCQDRCPEGIDVPSPEICNNVDDDCDGLIDEGLRQPCQTACGEGNERCEAGVWVECNAAQPGPEACDGVDDDCDGMVDEGDDLCDGGQGCYRAECWDRCEFGECPGGFACVQDVCVPA